MFGEIVLHREACPALPRVSVLLLGKGDSAVNATDFIKRANVGNSLRVFQNQMGCGGGIFHGKMVLRSGKHILCHAV